MDWCVLDAAMPWDIMDWCVLDAAMPWDIMDWCVLDAAMPWDIMDWCVLDGAIMSWTGVCVLCCHAWVIMDWCVLDATMLLDCVALLDYWMVPCPGVLLNAAMLLDVFRAQGRPNVQH